MSLRMFSSAWLQALANLTDMFLIPRDLTDMFTQNLTYISTSNRQLALYCAKLRKVSSPSTAFGLSMTFYGGLTALVWADVMSGYVMFVMVTYLTDVWNLKFTKASGILSFWEGLVSVLPFGFAFLVDAILGHLPMLMISTIFFSIGLAFLSMSTPPVLGPCKAYKPECIGQAQKIIYYVALVQMAIGLSGHTVSLFPFFRFQVEENSPIRDYSGRPNAYISARGVSLGIATLTLSLLPLIAKERWSVLFGVPAILYLVATILFFVGMRWYHSMEKEGSPLTKVLRVLTASTFKIFQKLPNEPSELHEKDKRGLEKIPHTPRLRFLDKAAILLPRQCKWAQERRRWRLCTVTEVEETKIAIRIIPVAISFIICGLVSSIGNTYFVEQANHMNHRVGRLKVPIFVLLIIFELSKLFFAVLYACIVFYMEKAKRKKYAPPVGIAVAMVFSILCCLTAAKVETRRLNVVRDHGLLDSPKGTVPMSMFWLVPQFFLLSGVSSFLECSVIAFFNDQAPASMRDYLNYFSSAVFGFGTMSSALSVHFVGKISERGGQRSWFQDTMNRSRLDKYYMLLAVLSAANLVYYALVAIFYPYKEEDEVEVETDEEYVPEGLPPLNTPIVYG